MSAACWVLLLVLGVVVITSCLGFKYMIDQYLELQQERDRLYRRVNFGKDDEDGG